MNFGVRLIFVMKPIIKLTAIMRGCFVRSGPFCGMISAVNKTRRCGIMQYTLYLDESETFTSSAQRYFTVGGVILPKTEESKISKDLIALKALLWGNQPNSIQYILHEKEISEAQHNGVSKNPCYSIFRQNCKVNTLYKELSIILKRYQIVCIGVCLDADKLTQFYGNRTNRHLSIALQLLLENYCHFLMVHNNAVGDICYESLQEPGNQQLRQRSYELEALGTMYYTSHFFQTHIGDIRFIGKSKNVPGLQIADFIPNTLARTAAKLPPKHKGFKITVLKQLYNGNMDNCYKYGLKVIP